MMREGEVFVITWILLILSVPITAGGYLWRRRVTAAIPEGEKPDKRQKRLRALATIVMLIGVYLLFTQAISLIFGTGGSHQLEFSLWAPRVDFYGFSLSTTTITTWWVMGVIILAAILLRVISIPRFRERPSGAQNVLEALVETILKYTNTQAHGVGEFLGSYIFAIAMFMVGCAAVELFGIRAPTSDITMTFALAILTFIFINWYGIKKKGVGGRIKALASPTPVVFIIRVMTDIAIPVSMASRLFGNMLGGMIVMDLLRSSLGNYAVGIPSVLGLYFNVFHPLIQAFIFVTLTLTFINEAIE